MYIGNTILVVTKMPILQRSLLFLFLLLMIHFPHGQKRFTERPWLRLYHRAEVLYVSPYATEKTDSLALSWYKQVIDLLTEKPEADRFLLDAYLKAGILSMGRRQNQEALKFFRGASLVKTRASFLPDTLLFKPYLFAGSVYYDLNNLDSALWFYKKAENILLQFPTVSESERLYNKLGAWYYETGDYRKSIPYFTKALSGMESKRTQDLYFIVNYRSNIASALRKMGYIDSSISIYKELLLSHINENELLHNIAVALLDENKNEEALFYLKKVSYESQARYNHMAQALLHLQKPKEAEKDLGYACQIYRKKGSPAHDFDYANTLRISGDLALAKGEIREALQLYQQSIIQLKSDFTDTSIFSNPYSFRILGNSFALFDVLTAKAKAFIQIPENGALHAFHAYEAALTLARQLELRYHSDEARFFLNDKVTPACHALVDLGIMLKEKTGDASYIDKIFRWCEGNKASVLQADNYALQLDSSSSLPVALLQESKPSPLCC